MNSVKKLLTDALNKNQYLKRLELQQIKDMVECMYERTYQQGEYVVQQGEPGNHLFVLAGRPGPAWSPSSQSVRWKRGELMHKKTVLRGYIAGWMLIVSTHINS